MPHFYLSSSFLAASLTAGLALVTFTGTAHASAPAGVWALVDEVTPLPDDKDPTMVRIDGVLMIANVQPDFPDYGGYSVPQVGYMYYSCEGKALPLCVMEWQELMAIAGTPDNCRGWGSNALPSNGVLRHPQLPMKDPDPYPIAQGVVQGFTPCEALRKWQMENAGGSTGGETTGDIDSDGEATGDTDTLSTGEGTTDPGTTGNAGTTGDADTTGKDETGPGPLTTGAGSDGPTTGGPTSETGALTGEPGGSTGTTGGTTGTPEDEPAGSEGCACDSRGGQGFPALAMLALFGLRRRRAA